MTAAVLLGTALLLFGAGFALTLWKSPAMPERIEPGPSPVSWLSEAVWRLLNPWADPDGTPPIIQPLVRLATDRDREAAAALVAERTAPDTLLVFDAIGWPPFWASQIYHNVAHYLARHPESMNLPLLLLRDEPDEALRKEIEEFARLVVVSPRVDAIPNPVPTRFQPVERTAHVHQIGRVYVFERGLR